MFVSVVGDPHHVPLVVRPPRGATADHESGRPRGPAQPAAPSGEHARQHRRDGALRLDAWQRTEHPQLVPRLEPGDHVEGIERPATFLDRRGWPARCRSRTRAARGGRRTARRCGCATPPRCALWCRSAWRTGVMNSNSSARALATRSSIRARSVPVDSGETEQRQHASGLFDGELVVQRVEVLEVLEHRSHRHTRTLGDLRGGRRQGALVQQRQQGLDDRRAGPLAATDAAVGRVGAAAGGPTGAAHHDRVASMKSMTTRASSGPRSSWRKWPPPSIVVCGWPAAPGTLCWNTRSPPLVIGSLSRERRQHRLVPRVEHRPRRTVRLGGGVVGRGRHEQREATRASLETSSGKGASYAATTSSERSVVVPIWMIMPESNTSTLLGEALPVQERLGRGAVTGRQAGVGDDQPANRSGMAVGETQADEPAPVLAHEGDVGEVERFEPLGHPGDVRGVGVVRLRRRACRTDRSRRGRGRRRGGPRRRSTGIMWRYRYDHEGSPCMHSTGDASAGPRRRGGCAGGRRRRRRPRCSGARTASPAGRRSAHLGCERCPQHILCSRSA